jgi:hypothetical protein
VFELCQVNQLANPSTEQERGPFNKRRRVGGQKGVRLLSGLDKNLVNGVLGTEGAKKTELGSQFIRGDYTQDEEHQADRQKYEEKYFGDFRRTLRNAGEAQQCGDDRYYEKDGGPTQHVGIL